MALTNADFEYKDDAKKNGSDFISYNLKTYFLSPIEKNIILALYQKFK